jgi:N-acetylmuramoyl-L-alanine amidase
MPKIFINPGHAPNGEPDPGAVNGNTGLRESDVVSEIGLVVATYLQKVGYQVQVMQSDSLESIVDAANDGQFDLFVSIHCNSAGNSSAKGAETWYCHNSDAGARLATLIQGQLTNSLPLVDRGIKDATPSVNGLYVLTNTNMPACLVETAFISNEDDESLLADSAKQDVFARAIARGISDYFA